MHDLNYNQIVEQFKIIRRRQYIATVPFLIVVIVVISESEDVAIFGLSTDVILIIAMILLVGFILFSFKNWRCPSCNAYLGKNLNPKFCPNCGTRLQ